MSIEIQISFLWLSQRKLIAIEYLNEQIQSIDVGNFSWVEASSNRLFKRLTKLEKIFLSHGETKLSSIWKHQFVSTAASLNTLFARFNKHFCFFIIYASYQTSCPLSRYTRLHIMKYQKWWVPPALRTLRANILFLICVRSDRVGMRNACAIPILLGTPKGTQF